MGGDGGLGVPGVEKRVLITPRFPTYSEVRNGGKHRGS